MAAIRLANEQSGETIMEQKRTLPRKRTLKRASIVFKGRSATIDCVVRNMSEAGACLKVESPLGIPDEFELTFEAGDIVRRCRVVWRKETQVGVAFL
jgi:hypothetical protein